MMRRTNENLAAMHLVRFSGGAPQFMVAPKKYVRHMPMNPSFGAKHDGVTPEFGKGYTAIDIPFLNRFRHNTLPLGCGWGKWAGKNPVGKQIHYLEVNQFLKCRPFIFGPEGIVHTLCIGFICVLTVVHLLRYVYAHPDLTMYNFVLWPTKPLVHFSRMDQKHPMDKPAFRLFQRPIEYGVYDEYRDMIRLGYVANDPWLVYIKSIGKEKSLLIRPGEGDAPNLWPPHKDWEKTLDENPAHKA